MKNNSIRESYIFTILLALIISTISVNFLFFHTLSEIFSILISFSIFVFGWNTRHHFNNNYLLTISIAHFFIALLDIIHTFSYKGMMILNLHADIATQYWIASRYLESITFLLAYYLLNKKANANLLLFSYFIITALIFISISTGYFPECYVDGKGLTQFKIFSEYIISSIFFVAVFQLRGIHHFSERVKTYVTISLITTIFSELSFTLYMDVYGVFNVIGHIFKIIAFYFLYKAILEVGLNSPMDLLMSRLQKSEEENRKNQELLVQQARFIAAGEVLNNIAHQWRQPLTALDILIQDIEDAYENGELDRAYMNASILKSRKMTLEMSNMIDYFTTFYATAEHKSEFDVKDAIEDILAMSNANLDNMNIVVHVEKLFSYRITGFYNDFIRAIFNILVNSIDICRRRKIENGMVTISTNEMYDGKLKLTISDNAGGIESAIKDKIFEPYTTTKHRSFGVGLGLYISKIIIEEHMNGKIYAENGPEGAVFTIEI